MNAQQDSASSSLPALILEVLYAVRRLALSAGCSEEDAGLDSAELIRLGVRLSQLRALKKDGLIQSLPGKEDKGRAVTTIRLGDRDSIIFLTPSGIQGVERQTHADVRTPAEKASDPPEWDGINLDLFDHGKLLHHYPRRGKRLASLLDQLQREGWPAQMKVVLESEPTWWLRSALKDTVERLNHDTKKKGLAFWIAADGATVCWQREEAPRG